MDRISPFDPLAPQPEREDPLIRAFLAALKYDSLLQVYLRSLVQMHLPAAFKPFGTPWEPAHVSMRSPRIETSPSYLISVVLTGEPTYEEIRVRWSDREPCYDGVVVYSDAWTLILTNKVRHGSAWKDRLSPCRSSVPDGTDDVRLYDWAVCLQWPEVLDGMLRCTRSAVPPLGNRELVDDLLSFVEATRPGLAPYRTFELCGDRHEALERRTCRLVGDIAALAGVEHDGNHLRLAGRVARRIGLIPLTADGVPWRLGASLWPAGTAAQANALHDALQAGNRRADFLFLDGYDDWHVEPNLSFSFMGTKLAWARSPCGLPGYLRHFYSQARPYGRRCRDEWATLIRDWEQDGVIPPHDGDRIREVLGDRPFIDVNPEFWICRDWDRDTVIALEKEGRLAAHLRDAFATPLAAWGETLGDA